MNHLRLLILLSLFVFSSSVLGQTKPTTSPTTKPTVKYFFVYSQPVEELDKWNSLGFNGYFLSETKNKTVDRRKSRQKATALGWKYFDAYIDDDDVNDPNLLGWVPDNSDEWNRRKPNLTPIIDQVGYLQELNKSRGSNKIVMVNGDGMAITTAMWEKVYYNGVKNSEKSIYTIVGGWSNDWYPVVNTKPDTPEQRLRRPMYLPAQASWVLYKRWAPAWGVSPVSRFQILEANKNWSSPSGVTPPEMREQLKYVLGELPFPVPDANAKPVNFQGQLADGIVYWTQNGQDGPGWRWDTTTPEIKATLASIISEYKAPPAVPVDPALENATRRIVELEIELKASKEQTDSLVNAAETYLEIVRASTQPSTQPTTKPVK